MTIHASIRDLIKRLLSNSRYKRALSMIVIVLAFIVIGSVLLFIGRAAVTFVSTEPERGTVQAPAKSVADPSASNNQAVQFKAARQLPSQILNVAYGSDSLQVMDIYPSTDGKVRPAVIMVHGGGWRAGDKELFEEDGKQLSRNGFTVFNMNYRLATPDVPGYPMQIDDITAVVRLIQSNGADYNADPADINMVGGSAGGHLAALTSVVLNTQNPGTIQATATLSGGYDFTAYARDDASDDQVIGGSFFLGCDVRTECSTALLKEVSPMMRVDKNCPAMFLMNSSNEVVPVSQAQNMYDRLLALGCDAKLQIVEGSQHAEAYWDEVATPIIQWLKAQ